jgi:Putative metal-binding motif
MLIRALLLAVVLGLCAPAGAQATAIIDIVGTTIIYHGVPGDIDQVAVFETPTTIRFTRFGAGQLGGSATCDFVGADLDTVDCTKFGITSIVLDLDDGNDVASVSPTVTVSVIFNGGPGNDGLFGGGGLDIFNGGPGDDNIISRDGRAEQVDCGDGHDTAISDDADSRISCEEIEGDADGDGVRRPTDCDDTNPAIHPGAVDIPDNRIDEDCNGVDAVNNDRDGDGSPRPQDCNDTNRSIHPGAREVIGNTVDENCDGVIEPYPPLIGSVAGTWSRAGSRTRNVTLVAKGFAFRTVITLTCTGAPQCPRGTITRRVGRARHAVNLHLVLAGRSFPKRARIVLRFTRNARVGRELRYQMSTPGLPDVEFLCRPPGGSSGPC